MKTLFSKIALVALFAMSLSLVSASGIDKEPNVYEEIRELIEDIPMDFAQQEKQVIVKFMITAGNEIIVLSTDSEDYDTYLKSALNYKVLESDELQKNKTYILPITLEKK